MEDTILDALLCKLLREFQTEEVMLLTWLRALEIAEDTEEEMLFFNSFSLPESVDVIDPHELVIPDLMLFTRLEPIELKLEVPL